MKIDKKILSTFIGYWLPVISMIFMAGYVAYKAYEVSIFFEIKGGNFETDLALRIARGQFFTYALFALVIILAVISMWRWRVNEKDRNDLIDRINWSVERLASIEAQGATPEKSLTKWPWGAHHTDALGHLEAAANRFWVLYDPAEPSTAPTNEMVAGWLRQERGVTKERAAAIASILRADGLRTGPR